MLVNIGGRHVSVEALMGPGVDPHLYKATPGDRRALNGADVVFFSGLHLEGRLATILEKLAERKPVYAVTGGLLEDHAEELLRLSGTESTYDPHVWFDVSLWARCVDYAAEKLATAHPARAEDYRRNAQAYRARLDDLHQRCKDALSAIPKEQRVLVTAHDAFGYFGRAYDVEVRGLQGISTLDEADLRAVNNLVDLLARRKIKSVFVESSVPPRNVEALVESCEARGHEVVVGGELFSDAMGPPGTPEGTYVGMVEHNLTTIVHALK
jgi:manganese/zinc/iron transport system substrate-binding protein